MYFLVTVSTSDPAGGVAPPTDGEAPAVRTSALRELQQEHVVAACWRRLDGSGLYLLVEAGDEDEVRRDMARLGTVGEGWMRLTAVRVELV